MLILIIILTALVAGFTCFLTLRLDNNYDTLIPSMISGVSAALVQLGIHLWLMPTVGFFYPGMWLSLVLAGLIGAGLAFIVNQSASGFTSPAVILILFFVISIPSSCEIFHAKKYQSLIGNVSVKNFTDEIPPVKLDEIRLVSKNTAYVLAKKVLGKTKDGTVLGSQLEIDEDSAAIQEVNGQLWWIFPLDFAGFFKWRNRAAIPGYIRVNAQDPTKEAELIDVDQMTGKKFSLQYTRKAYFGKWLDRYIYFRYPFMNQEDCTFEVNDDWQPYYVVSVTKPLIGFSGYQTDGVILADPQTGEIRHLQGDEIPQWVDRVKPLHLTITQVTNWGEYVNGWWNSHFAMKDVKVPTSHSYGKDMWFIKFKDKKYWFTGLTSASSKDQSLVGAIMVETRSGNATFYAINGTDESGVVQAVDASLGADSSRWSPTQPIPYNVFGVPTWVLPIVSNEGIYQKVALVDMNNINTIVSEKSIGRAVEKYREILARHHVKGDAEVVNEKGLRRIGPVRVLRVGNAVSGGNKTFYLLVEGYDARLFSSSGETDQTRVITLVKPEDRVFIKFFPSDSQVISIESITVNGLGFK